MIRASSIQRYRNCAGAPSAEMGIPERDEAEWTTNGTLIHAALESKESYDKITDPELLEIVDSMDMSKNYILDKVFPDEEGIERIEVIKERQFFVEYEGQQIISGHPDFIQIGTIRGVRVALILDFKSGYLAVSAPESNDQLRGYAVAVWQDKDLKIDEVYASIIPRFGVAATPVHYAASELPLALLDLVEVHAASQDEKAVRVPSVIACRYCKARSTSKCPETLYPDRRLKEMPSLIALSPAQKGELLVLCEIVAGNIKTLKERLYDELTNDPAAVDGWHLVPGDVRGSISDAAACFQVVSDMMTAEEFQACLKVGMTDLKTELKGKLIAAENLKAKAANIRIAAILDPVTVKKQGEPKLEKKG